MSVDLNEKIIESLKQLSVKELPDFKITSEMISGINIKDGNVQFLLELNENYKDCLLYTSPSPRDLSTSRMPSSA